MGETDKNSLQAALEQSGWRVERQESDAWWLHECWQLTSTWRPVGATAFLAFLVDPLEKASDIGSVWAIGVMHDRPDDKLHGGQNAIRVRPRWPDRMKEIVEAAGALRPAD